jgi:uncharacterized protein (DUF2141 family)
MKQRLFLLALLLVLLAGCGKQPTYTDNGNLGVIKAVAFFDDNANGKMDTGEEGVPAEIGISQDISCPAMGMDKITVLPADATGIALFMDLKPGKYCVNPVGNYGMTTKMNLEVYLSSEQETLVTFGLVRP